MGEGFGRNPLLVIYFHFKKVRSFFSTQRYKCKLLTLAMALFFLSINIEDFRSVGQKGSLHQAKNKMVVNQILQFPKSNHECNMEQIFSSVYHGRQLSALQMALVPDVCNQLQEYNIHVALITGLINSTSSLLV
jgi:hypothetical protein